MKRSKRCQLVLGVGSVLLSSTALTDEVIQTDHEIETLTVYGERVSPLAENEVTALRTHHGAADVAKLVALMPGADVADNGPISGQIQYRGLTGPRIDVMVNGMHIVSGGPNWMDPPMHYVPPGLLHSVKLKRGITPVTRGNVGAQANAEWKRPEFGDELYLDVDTSLRSVDAGSSFAVTAGGATEQHRAYVSASNEAADDYRSADTDIQNTGFDRSAFGAGYGFLGASQALDIRFFRIDFDDAGTPNLPLDIEFLETTLAYASYSASLGEHRLSVTAATSDIDHRMNNYSMRPPPDFSSLPLRPFTGADRRFVNAKSQSNEFRVSYEMPLGQVNTVFGIDILDEEHSATVYDPDFSPFFVDNFVESRI